MRVSASLRLRPRIFETLPAANLARTWLSALLVVCFIPSAFGGEPPAPPTNTLAPRIRFANPICDLGKVRATGTARCEFVFTNEGNALLELTSVQPECGCTVAGDWSRQVEPGKTGVVPLEFHAPDFRGLVEKKLTVLCNDPAQPSVVLQLKAVIWKPVEVNPPYAILKAVVDSPASVQTAVRIISHLEEPVTLSEPESTNRFFAVELKTVRPGKEFELVVKTVPPLPAFNPQQFIRIKTSAPGTPEISVPTVAIIEPLLVVAPSQFVLPANPLKQKLEFAVTIRNNDAAPMTLSAAKVTFADSEADLKGLAVVVREIEPGRQFTLTLALPGGFEIPAGKKLELQVQTSHPKFPVVKVPWCVAPCF